MRMDACFGCTAFPCPDVRHERYTLSEIDLDPQKISIVLISECAAAWPGDDYYAPGDPLFARTTLQAFNDAGAPVRSVQDILELGVYLTTAVKCAKTGYGIAGSTIENCSFLLEQELDLFPNVRAYLLMGDVAIKSVNLIARRNRQPRPIPAGAIYKMRGQEYTFRGRRAFPSYLQAGPSFFIEKSKRRMIAEDIAAALDLWSYFL
jgi:uracil-DNA glycosylase